MPIYTYCCSKCKKIEEAYRPVTDFAKPLDCSCGAKARHIIDFSKRLGPSYPFIDNYMDAKPVKIESLSHYRKELKKRNLQEASRGKGNKGQWV